MNREFDLMSDEENEKEEMDFRGVWKNVSNIGSVSYTCGFCNNDVAPSQGYYSTTQDYMFRDITSGILAICPKCNLPTFINKINDNLQTPQPRLGKDIPFLPKEIKEIYNEARNCISVHAYNSAALSCRKLLMNVAFSKGAKAGEKFAVYVDFLDNNHFIPPGGKGWVDHIRKKGNEATHEIPNLKREDALELLDFTEMLLRNVFEMPGKMAKYQ
ncbi:DUF4145 domain-containing protein [Cytobacillus depressus]|uniref:DUF4145 domain-containing protein n=1 Tax=Cytobacillus depressus TaxID=1602942 RepID=A0A6L3VEQ0_9BACI|nr:DUF4145 domain-containing protein [Cytobacillus depressus]KAB2337641.1 DUF4145 domain-containing protein [Cytobacillus depressus]